EQVASLGCGWDDGADEVGRCEQLGKICLPGAGFGLDIRFARAIVIKDIHTKAQSGAARDGLTDTAHADDTEALVVNIDAELCWADRSLPVASANPTVQF